MNANTVKNLIIILLLAVVAWLAYQAFFHGTVHDTELIVEDTGCTSEYCDSLVSDNYRLDRLADSMHTMLLNQPKPKVESHAAAPPPLSAAQKELQTLALGLNDGFGDMFRDNDPKHVLQHFQPRKTTNEVFVNTHNIALVRRHNNEDLDSYLGRVAVQDDVEFDLGGTRFFETYVRDDLGVVIYLAHYQEKIKGKLVQEGNMLVMLTCKQYEGQPWKIGNFSFVQIREFDLLNKVAK